MSVHYLALFSNPLYNLHRDAIPQSNAQNNKNLSEKKPLVLSDNKRNAFLIYVLTQGSQQLSISSEIYF